MIKQSKTVSLQTQLVPWEESDSVDSDRLNAEIREVTTLYNMGVAVGSSLNLREVLWTLYKESGRLVDVSNFGVALYDSQSDLLYFHLVFDEGQKVSPFSFKLSRSKGVLNRILSTQFPILIPDLSQTELIVEIDRIRSDAKVRSWLGVPIFNPVLDEDGLQGAIMMWSYEPDAFDDHDLWLLSAIGTQASIAIRNAKLYEASQRRAMEMAVLNDVAHTLSSTLNLDEVLSRIMDQVESMLNVEAGSLLLIDPSTGELIFQIALGDKSEAVKPFRIPKGEGIVGKVALTGEPIVVEDVKSDQRHFKKLDLEIDFETRNILCVPLVLYEKVIGVIEVMNKKSGHFNQEDKRLLTSVASYAAIAIDNARLHESVMNERDRVIEAEELARKKLARDLHDGPTQLVSSIMMSLDFSTKALKKDPSLLEKELEYMQKLVERAAHQMRTMLFELRPLILETKGLRSALELFIERRQKDIGPKPKLSLEIKTIQPDGEISRLGERVEATIFAIVQETVNNAIKHAQAKDIIIKLRETFDVVYTVIADNGQGFNVDEVMNNYDQRGSLGMINIRERAEAIGSELTIKSVINKGSRFTVCTPKGKTFRKKKGLTGMLNLPPL